MAKIVKNQFEKMIMEINDLTEVLREGNYYYDKSIVVTKK